MKQTESSDKTSLREKLGYSIADCGITTVYVLTGTYLLFFLTTVAGLSPAAAGSITALAAIWNALVNPVVGYLSDNCRARMGRRRPLMAAAALPLACLTCLLYTSFPIPAACKPACYGFLLLLFWTCFDLVFVPYYALGAAYTSDYQDRIKMRLLNSFFILVANILGMASPTLLVSLLRAHGMSNAEAWSIMAAILGIGAAALVLLTVAASRGKDQPAPPKEADGRQPTSRALIRFFKVYLDVARLGPMRPLIVVSLASLIAYVIVLSDLVYLLTYCMHFPAARVSLFMMLQVLPGLFLLPLTGRLLRRIDKKRTMILFYGIAAAGLIILRLAFSPCMPWIFAYLFLSSIVTSVYWQIIPAAYYDVCEYDYAEHGVHREAAIVSFQSFIEAIAEGLGAQVLGLALQLGGFNGSAAVQSARALAWIGHAATIVPVLFIVIMIIAMSKYPIDRTAYAKILAKADARQAEEEPEQPQG